MIRSAIFSMRCDVAMLDELDKLVGKGQRFRSTSEAMRETSRLGLMVLRHQELMQDPKKAQEFAEKMRELIKNEEFVDWAKTLESGQLDGFIMLLEMEKTERYKQERFV